MFSLALTDWLCIIGFMAFAGFLCWQFDAWQTRKLRSRSNTLRSQASGEGLSEDRLGSPRAILKSATPRAASSVSAGSAGFVEQISNKQDSSKQGSSKQGSKATKVMKSANPLPQLEPLSGISKSKPRLASSISAQSTIPKNSSSLAKERLQSLGLGSRQHAAFEPLNTIS